MKTIYYAIQNVVNGKGSNVTKVLSLALGLTIGILLFSQIAFELSYDKCWTQWEQLAIVRIKNTVNHQPNERWSPSCEGTMSAALMENFPDKVQSVTSYTTALTNDLYKEDGTLLAPVQMYADSLFFRTLDIPVLEGNPIEDLKMPQSLYISESYAKEIFGDENPVGKKLTREKLHAYTIKGVYKDIPENTYLPKANIIISIQTLYNMIGHPRWWSNQFYQTIVRMKDSDNLEYIDNRLQSMVEKYVSFNLDKTGQYCEYGMIPFTDARFENPSTSNRLIIYGALGFSIVFVSLMNYILTAIANLSRRAKMAGVHKCCGAEAGNIMSMFLIETSLIVLISLLVAAFLILNCADLIKEVLSSSLAGLFTWHTLWVPLLCICIVLLIGGCIPGYIYAKIPATQAFRRYTDGKKGWKRSLLFVQFTGVSFILGLLIVTLLQYHHLMTQPLGYNPDGLVTAQIIVNEKENIMDDIRRQPMVEECASASTSILSSSYYGGPVTNESGQSLFFTHMLFGNKDLPQTIGLQLSEGRWMNSEGEVMVNEEYVRRRNWTDGAIGKVINNPIGSGNTTIIGVFKDFRNMGINYELMPLILTCHESMYHVHIRLKEPYDDNQKRLQEYLQTTYPNVAIRLESINKQRKEMSQSTYKFRNSVLITSGFILLIVLIGLIGYVNDETQRRSKEIAIRKVNGGEASDILRLLSVDILYVSIPSVIIGTIIAWIVGKTWLEQFAETFAMNPMYFIGLALGVLVLIVLCVVIKAWRIANENPVLSIKSE